MENVPQHVAAIPDGNRRWAKKRGLPGTAGHAEGLKHFYDVMDEAFAQGVRYFTLWAASESNLTKRTKLEVDFLMALFRDEILRHLDSKKFIEKQIRVRVRGKGVEMIGNQKLTEAVRKLEEESSQFADRNLTILFGYNGTTEMLEAIRGVAGDPSTSSGSKDEIEAVLRKHLWTGELPPVDFVIRTGMEGDPHNSAGFMMWQTAESQLYFTETFWPDFGKEEFAKALGEYGERERRLGK